MRKINQKDIVEIRCDECDKVLGAVVQFLTESTTEAIIVMLCPKCLKAQNMAPTEETVTLSDETRRDYKKHHPRA